jgi:hypothetical protein
LSFSWRLIRDNYVKQRKDFVQQSAAHARMHWLGIRPLAIASIWRGLPPICHRFSAAGIFCTAKCPVQKYFLAHDQALAAAIPAAHDQARKFHFTGTQRA